MQRFDIGIRYLVVLWVCTVAIGILFVAGCGPALSTREQLKEFDEAGPIVEGSDIEGLLGTVAHIGPYRVAPGDLLKMHMPAYLRIISTDVSTLVQTDLTAEAAPYLCRVSDTGVIALPIVGEMKVGGHTLGQIEISAIKAYYPKYAAKRPMIVCEVSKYNRESERAFTVMGLVNKPGVFPYPPDVKYNLTEALASAGGLNLVADPRYVKVYRQDVDGDMVCATFKIDNKSFQDAYAVEIKPGDVVYVNQTFRTRMNSFLSSVFRIYVSADLRATGLE